ncbi:hypothetical protein HK098_000187, partial [Nowakowskiella sp. JEL0407]
MLEQKNETHLKSIRYKNELFISNIIPNVKSPPSFIHRIPVQALRKPKQIKVQLDVPSPAKSARNCIQIIHVHSTVHLSYAPPAPQDQHHVPIGSTLKPPTLQDRSPPSANRSCNLARNRE